MRFLRIATIWATAAAVALVIAWTTAAGPVVLVLERRQHHGVHLSDIVAVLACAAWAAVRTGRVLREERAA